MEKGGALREMGLRLTPGELLARLREKGPLVQCVQNTVAMDISANAMVSVGASPAMVCSTMESSEFIMHVTALSVNMGTLSRSRLMQITAAVVSAKSHNKPWVLDPVGCGGSPYRLDACRNLCDERPNVVRGNASEIITLAGAMMGSEESRVSGKGVDSTESSHNAVLIAKKLAKFLGNVIVVTGEVDIITDGNTIVKLSNGVPEVAKIIAVGCSLSCIVAAMIGVSDGMHLEAAVAACAVVAVSSEGATCSTPGSLRVHWMDRLNMITPEQLDEAVNIELDTSSAPKPGPKAGLGASFALDMRKVQEDCKDMVEACLMHPVSVFLIAGTVEQDVASAFQANMGTILSALQVRPGFNQAELTPTQRTTLRMFDLLDSCKRVSGAAHIMLSAVAVVQAAMASARWAEGGAADEDQASVARKEEEAKRLARVSESQGKTMPHHHAVAYFSRALELQLELLDNTGPIPHRPEAYLKGARFVASSIKSKYATNAGSVPRALNKLPPRVLIIAGSDSGGAAGIQADIKACEAMGAYSMTAVSALTAQNSLGVQGVWVPQGDFLEKQITSCISDFGCDVIKTGMISSPEHVAAICAAAAPCELYKWVVDPVMVSTSGHTLVDMEAVAAIKDKLFPLAWLITPNIPEAQLLLGRKVDGKAAMAMAAKHLGDTGIKWVLLKGGHNEDLCSGESADLLYETQTGKQTWFSNKRIDSKNTHGTGCTLASAIAANLAQGMDTVEAVGRANAFVWDAIRGSSRLRLGGGHGPLHHAFRNPDWSLPHPRKMAFSSQEEQMHRGKSVDYSVYAVTDEDCLEEGGGGSIVQAVEKALQGGVTVVQLRMKDSGGADMLRTAKELVPICRAAGVPLIINDRIDVAIAADADGVHVGQQDMPAADARRLLGKNKILGVSCKTPELADQAVRDGADYIGSGAVWGTNTKDTTVIGLEGLSLVVKASSVPVVAIGGVSEKNAAEAIAAGAAGVAVVSAIFKKKDVKSAAVAVATSVSSARQTVL